MSLKDAAQHLASKGRGPDTLLIHMAPSEVVGLQALAKAAGGSLTVNPHTGLPEAGFLESLLPTIIGAGVTAATGGAAAPWMIGAGIGGLQALRTGSLTKGLTAGLGAYGGAGLTSGLADMGSAALQASTAAEAAGGNSAGPLSGAAWSNSGERGFGDKLKAGFSTFDWNKPTDFVGGLGGGSKKTGAALLGAAALPTVMEALAPQQVPGGMASDSVMPRRLRYDIATRSYVPISQQEAYAIRGYADGGLPEWNKEWAPDTPGYGNQGQDFGREILYYNPKTSTDEELVAKKSAGLAGIKPAETQAANPSRGYFGGRIDPETGKPFGWSPWDDKTDAEKAQFYAENPGWAAVTQAGQNLIGATTLGQALKYANPQGWGEAETIARGMDPAGITFGAPKGGFFGFGAGKVPDMTPEQMGYGSSGYGFTTRDGGGSSGPLSGAAWGGGDTSDSSRPTGLASLQGSGYNPNGFSTPSSDSDGSSTDGAAGGYLQNGVYQRPTQNYADGGLGSLGSYSDGGRLLRGPGDGVSDSIPATIGHGKQPARLADGEFVVPARIVSELGNGSTEAGARKLYAMMDRIQKARSKSVGKDNVAVDSKAHRLLPA